jgi:hypothetical protein
LRPKLIHQIGNRGKGPYSLKLTPAPKDNLIDVHLSASEGSYFEGTFLSSFFLGPADVTHARKG